MVDYSVIYSAFVPADLISLVLSITVLLSGLYLVVFAIAVVLVAIRGGTISDQAAFVSRVLNESRFNDRYRREQKTARYRAWKKSKGYK
jgi:uncharacterized membrane protein